MEEWEEVLETITERKHMDEIGDDKCSNCDRRNQEDRGYLHRVSEKTMEGTFEIGCFCNPCLKLFLEGKIKN